MFCRKCGKENPDDAVYCQKCGTLLEAEEETRVAGRNVPDYVPPISSKIGERDRRSPIAIAPGSNSGDDPEAKLFSIRPTLIFVKIGYATAVIGALLLVALLTIVAPAIPWWVVVPVGLMLLLIPAFYHLKQKLVSYKLTDTALEIDSGFVSRNTRNIPLRRIQDVTVSATAWHRLLGYGDVIIDNASQDGGRVVLKNINSPRHYADMLLRQMRLLDK